MTKQTKAADDTGAMIALYLPSDIAQRLALPGGEPISELHLTLCYLGDMEEIAENAERLKQFVAEFAATHYLQPARIGGIGRFNRISDEGTQAVYATVDSPNLPQFRQELVSGAEWSADVEPSRAYGFVPHVTMAYVPTDAPMPLQNIEPLEFSFKQISLSIGPERWDYDLITEAKYINTAVSSMGIKAGARNSIMDMKRIQGAHDLMCELGAKCTEPSNVVYREKAVGLDRKLRDAGATLDEIIGIYTNRKDKQKYYVNFGDWATKETIDAIKQVLGDIESEAEASPPEDEWQQIWPKRGKAKDPDVGGGVDRDELKDSDFVFSDTRTFPIVAPGDVSDAVSSWGRYKGERSFEDFKKKLTALAKRKGPEFEKELPKEWKKEAKKTADSTFQGAPVEIQNPVDNGSSPSPAIESTPNNALKAISVTDDQLITGNFLVLFNGRDLEGVMSANKNADGSNGEYFTPNTQFESDYTSIGRLPVDWEHGRGLDGLEKHDKLGYVDWSTAKTTDTGLWVQRVLNRRNRYVQMLEPLIKAGLIGTSSEAIPDKVSKAANGEILTWPLMGDALTVNPMDYRMMDSNTLTALKALALEVPAVKSACQKLGIDTEGQRPEFTEGQREAARLRLKAKQVQVSGEKYYG